VRPYEGILKNAFKNNDNSFLIGLLEYAESMEEEHITDMMIELNICPNCGDSLATVVDNEVHGYSMNDPLVEVFRHKKCTTCHYDE
jgi:uncharacterized protein with PIN domain